MAPAKTIPKPYHAVSPRPSSNILNVMDNVMSASGAKGKFKFLDDSFSLNIVNASNATTTKKPTNDDNKINKIRGNFGLTPLSTMSYRAAKNGLVGTKPGAASTAAQVTAAGILAPQSTSSDSVQIGKNGDANEALASNQAEEKSSAVDTVTNTTATFAVKEQPAAVIAEGESRVNDNNGGDQSQNKKSENKGSEDGDKGATSQPGDQGKEDDQPEGEQSTSDGSDEEDDDDDEEGSSGSSDTCLSSVSQDSIVEQNIVLSGDDINNTERINGNNVCVFLSKSTETNHSGSNKVKINPIVKFEWPRIHYSGHLVTTHFQHKLFAYALKGKSGGMVRIVSTEKNNTCLIKSRNEFQFVDIAFSYSTGNLVVKLALVNSIGTLYIYDILQSDDRDISYILKLTLTQDAPEKPPLVPIAQDMYHVLWCKYESDPLSNSEAEEPEHTMLLLTNYNEANIIYVNSIEETQGVFKGQVVDVCSQFSLVTEFKEQITCASFAQDGSALALAGIEGVVMFYQFMTLQKTPCSPSSFKWKPHDGKPISSLYFLNDKKQAPSDGDAVFWKFVITGCNNNSEFKLWQCETWKCLQTIQVHPPIASNLSSKKCKAVEIVTCIDTNGDYLICSDVNRSVLIVLEINQEIKANKETGCVFVSVTELLMSQPCLNMSVMSTSLTNKLKEIKEIDTIDEFGFEIEEGPDEIIDFHHKISIFSIHTKSMQHLQLCFKVVNELPGNKAILNSTCESGISSEQQSILTDTTLNDTKCSSLTNVTALDSVIVAQDTTNGTTDPPLAKDVKRNDSDEPIDLQMKFSSLSKYEGRNILSDPFERGDFARVPDPALQAIKKDVAVDEKREENKRKEVEKNLLEEERIKKLKEEEEKRKKQLEDKEKLRQLDEDKVHQLEEERKKLKLKIDEETSRKFVENIKLEEEKIKLENEKIMLEKKLRKTKEQPKVSKEFKEENILDRAENKSISEMKNMLKQMMVKFEDIDKRIVAQENVHYANNQRVISEMQIMNNSFNKQIRKLDDGFKKQIDKNREKLISNLDAEIAKKISDSVIPNISITMNNMRKSIRDDITKSLSNGDAVLKNSVDRLINSKSTIDKISQGVNVALKAPLDHSIKNQLVPALTNACRSVIQESHANLSESTAHYIREVNQTSSYLSTEFLNNIQPVFDGVEKIKIVMDKVEDNLNTVKLTNNQHNVVQSEIKELLSGVNKSMANSNKSLIKNISSVVGKEVQTCFQEHKESIKDTMKTAFQQNMAQYDTEDARSVCSVKVPQKPIVSEQTILAFLQNQKYNEAFRAALKSDNLHLVLFTCNQLEPKALFASDESPLQQTVLLSLIQQLGTDLQNDTPLKISYIQESILSLDPEHPKINAHIEDIMMNVCDSIKLAVVHHSDVKLKRQLRQLNITCQSLAQMAQQS